MDDRIIASSSILGLVQDSIEAILCHFASTEKLVKGVRLHASIFRYITDKLAAASVTPKPGIPHR